MWSIQHGSESIMYAVDWGQAKENVVARAAWLGGIGGTGADVMDQLRRPTALVCSSKGSNSFALAGGSKKRDAALLDYVRRTIDQGGNVLIPCDTSGRVLELAYTLERAWSAPGSNPFQRAKLFFASSTSQTTMRYVRSMLEWMDDNIVREFEAANNQPGRTTTKSDQKADGKLGQPFEFKHLKLLERKSQLQRALAASGPKIFLASTDSLEWGFSKDILQQMATDPRNLVILTGQSSNAKGPIVAKSSSPYDVLWSLVGSADEETGAAKIVRSEGESVTLKKYTTSALTGLELEHYQRYLAAQRQRRGTVQGDEIPGLETSADVIDEGASDSSSSEDESDDEHQGKALNLAATLTYSKHNKVILTDEELGVNILLRRKDVHDYDVRGKKGREKMFPFVAKRCRDDEFGDIIRPEDYLRAEERDEANGQDMRADGPVADADVGQKRKFDNGDAERLDNGRNAQMSNGKRRRTGRGEDGDGQVAGGGTSTKADEVNEQSDESDYEPAEPVISGPVKIITTSEQLHLNLSVTLVDFSGIHDQRALHMLLPIIRPRKLIFTGGSKEETKLLAANCRRILEVKDATQSTTEIFTPGLGSTVDASVHANAWTIKLSKSLFRHLKWQTFRELGIVTVNGRLQSNTEAEDEMLDGEALNKKQKTSTDTTTDQEKKTAGDTAVTRYPVLDVLPPHLASSTRSATPALHVGDLRLAELRKLMITQGHSAEFKGEGTLIVDNILAVRKMNHGKVIVEGAWFTVKGGVHSDAIFFTVKQKIYEGLAIVAAR